MYHLIFACIFLLLSLMFIYYYRFDIKFARITVNLTHLMIIIGIFFAPFFTQNLIKLGVSPELHFIAWMTIWLFLWSLAVLVGLKIAGILGSISLVLAILSACLFSISSPILAILPVFLCGLHLMRYSNLWKKRIERYLTNKFCEKNIFSLNLSNHPGIGKVLRNDALFIARIVKSLGLNVITVSSGAVCDKILVKMSRDDINTWCMKIKEALRNLKIYNENHVINRAKVTFVQYRIALCRCDDIIIRLWKFSISSKLKRLEFNLIKKTLENIDVFLERYPFTLDFFLSLGNIATIKALMRIYENAKTRKMRLTEIINLIKRRPRPFDTELFTRIKNIEDLQKIMKELYLS